MVECQAPRGSRLRSAPTPTLPRKQGREWCAMRGEAWKDSHQACRKERSLMCGGGRKTSFPACGGGSRPRYVEEGWKASFHVRTNAPPMVRGEGTGKLLPPLAGEGWDGGERERPDRGSDQAERCSMAATVRKRSASRLSRASRLVRTSGSSTLTITPSKNASTCGRSSASRLSTRM